METDSKTTGNSISRCFLVICAGYITCLLLSNLVAGKLTSVFGMTLPAAVILFPLTYILGDIITEVYGFRKARTAIWLGFSANAFAVLVYMAVIALPHPDFWHGQEAYRTVLGTTPRIFAASLAGYLFGEFSNAVILSRLKVRTNGRMLWLRTILSTIVGEALDTIIFITISFAGIIDSGTLITMMLCQYLFKVAYEVICTPATYWCVGMIKRVECIDTFDRDISYRPF